MYIDSGRVCLPFSSAQFCPISAISFDAHIEAHFSHPMPRPYVLSIVQESSGQYSFTDAISLVQSKRTYEKIHLYILKNCNSESFIFFRDIDGQIPEEFGRLLVAYSPQRSAEVDETRRELSVKRSLDDSIIEELCKRALHDDPNDAIALSELGDILRHKGELDLAARYLEQAIKKGDNSAFSMASRALIHHARGERVETCFLLLQAREREPENEGVKRVVEKVMNEDSLVGAILVRYNDPLDMYAIRMLLGALAAKLCRNQEACLYFSQAVTKDPEKWEGFAAYGDLLRKMAGQKSKEVNRRLLERAAVMFQRVLDLKVESTFVYARLGDVYRMQKDCEKAIWAFSYATALDHSNAFAWRGLGLVSEQLGSYNEAAEFYKEALLAKPNWTEIEIALGRALLQSGARSEAEGAFQRALECNPDNEEVKKELAVLAQEQRDAEFVAGLLVE